jgi:hypothetical protein
MEICARKSSQWPALGLITLLCVGFLLSTLPTPVNAAMQLCSFVKISQIADEHHSAHTTSVSHDHSLALPQPMPCENSACTEHDGCAVSCIQCNGHCSSTTIICGLLDFLTADYRAQQCGAHSRSLLPVTCITPLLRPPIS